MKEVSDKTEVAEKEIKFVYLHEGRKKLSSNRVISIAMDTVNDNEYIVYSVAFCSQRDRDDKFNKSSSRQILIERMQMGKSLLLHKDKTKYKYGEAVSTIINDMKCRAEIGGVRIPSWAKKLIMSIA